MTTPGTFSVLETYQFEPLWRFDLSRAPVATRLFDPRDGQRYGFKAGETRWNDDGEDPQNQPAPSSAASQLGADQIGNDAVYAWFQHRDNGGWYVNALRFFWQVAGQNDAKIDSSGMTKAPLGGSSLLAPYPQELGVPFTIDETHQGAVVQVRRVRFDVGPSQTQTIQHITIPPQDPLNAKLRWFYQNTGELLAVHGDLGVVGILTISASHPAYGYAIGEVK